MHAKRNVSIGQPFVGRETELATLRAGLGAGRVVLVAGEPGIGKTRLAEEFAAEAEATGALVHWGRCWEGDGAPAFWPWTQVIRAHLRVARREDVVAALGPAAAALAPLVPELALPTPAEPTPGELDPSQARVRLFDGVTGFVRTVAAARPTALVLEDLHWADTPSLSLLRYCVREIGPAPPLVLATYRDSGTARSSQLQEMLADLSRHRHSTHLTLGGLEEPAVRAYVERVHGAAPPDLIARLVHKTAGNPFFLTELVRLLGDASSTRNDLLDSVPDGVREAILQRVLALSPACRQTLRTAAVLGDEMTLTMLREAHDGATDDLLSALSEAIAARVLHAGPGRPGRYGFRHALIRQAVYEDLSLRDRIDLHRRIGEALEACYGTAATDHAAELARHFTEAASVDQAARAVTYHVRAGDHAGRVLAPEQAVEHYRTALEILRTWRPADEARACELLVRLGEAQVRAGEPKAAEELFLRAAALARTHRLPERLGEAALGLGQVERFRDRLGALLTEALDTLDTRDSVLRARLLSRLAVALYWDHPEERKRTLSDQAVAMARRLGHTPTLAYALSSRIATLSGPADVETRLQAAVEMTHLAARCRDRELDLVGRGWCIADRLALGEIRRVRHDIKEFDRLAHELRHPYFVWWATAIATMQALLEGRFADAERLAHDALALGQRAVTADATQVFAGHLYVLCMERERLGELEPLVRSVVEQFPLVPGSHCALALLYADSGRVREAEAELATLAENAFRVLPRNPDWLGSIAALTQASALLPAAPHAATLYDLLAPYESRIIVSGLGVLCSGAVAHFLGSLAICLGRLDTAERHLAQALSLHGKLGSPPFEAYSLYESARLAGARGDRARRDALCERAAAIATALGMRRLLRLVRLLAVDDGPPAAPAGDPGRTGMLQREGEFWTLAYAAGAFRLKDSVGLHYIAALLQDPGREFLAADLLARHRLERGAASAAAAPALPALGRRLAALRDELTEARTLNDADRARQLQTAIETLTTELARAVGIDAHGRRRAASSVERARVSVTRAIQGAVRRIGRHDPALGRHLSGAIRTGTFCAYVPDPEQRIAWRF